MFPGDKVTYFFKRPIGGTFALDGRAADWQLQAVSFKFRRAHEPADDLQLIESLHRGLVDEAGEEIPIEVLSLLGLEAGLRRAFTLATRDAWNIVYEGRV